MRPSLIGPLSADSEWPLLDDRDERLVAAATARGAGALGDGQGRGLERQIAAIGHRFASIAGVVVTGNDGEIFDPALEIKLLEPLTRILRGGQPAATGTSG